MRRSAAVTHAPRPGRFAVDFTIMTIEIRPIDPWRESPFGGSGSRLISCVPSPQQVAGPCRHGRVRHAGVPRPEIDDDQQCSSSVAASNRSPRAWGHRRHRAPRNVGQHGPERHLQSRQEQPRSLARDDRRRLFRSATSSGTRTARSREIPAKYSLLSGAPSRRPAAIPSSPTCGLPTIRSTRRPSAKSTTDLPAQPDLSRGILRLQWTSPMPSARNGRRFA